MRPGSSPLARGLPAQLAGDVGAGRIIPARAGFTASMRRARTILGDHPRSRGVYDHPVTLEKLSRGSSPIARGLPMPPPPMTFLSRIIPARAGFTIGLGSCALPMTDHPRSRGVYQALDIMTDTAVGSSPLARGLRAAVGVAPSGRRIIPARAGFTSTTSGPSSGCRDHPRSRGVYLKSLVWAWLTTGSSPLARGLRVGDVEEHGQRGIIPARAGFTLCTEREINGISDHPRSRGVYAMTRLLTTISAGSSPLARGLPRSGHPGGVVVRIIPARAGFTRHRVHAGQGLLDHPRSRGVYHKSINRFGTYVGSSPLARGLPFQLAHEVELGGIIPARAGFTLSRLSLRT